VFHGEHCVAMATAFEEISKLSRRCLHGWTVSTHLKFEHFLTIYTGVIAISYFMARDAMATAFEENSLLAHRHAEGWTINHFLKSGAVLTLFIGVTTTSCFLARDTHPSPKNTMSS